MMLTRIFVYMEKENILNGNIPTNTITLGNAIQSYPGKVGVDYADGTEFAKAIYNGTITPSGFNSYWKFEKTEKGATVKFGEVVVGSYTAE